MTLVWLLLGLPLVFASSFCPKGFQKSITGSFTVGQNQQKDMTSAGSSICYLTEGKAWRSDAHCQIKKNNGKWQLLGSSGHNDLLCGARCLTCGTTNIAEHLLSGQGKKNKRMLAQKDGFCYLAEGAAFKDGADACQIQLDAGYWTLYSTSNQNNFKCGAFCVPTNASKISDEYLLKGTGSDSKYMSDASNTICFISRGRGWYESGESCTISIRDGFWSLSKTAGSKQGNLECGARCATVNGIFHTNGKWEKVADAFAGAVSESLSTGVSTTETTTITKEWSTSFTVGIESGCVFEKISMSVTTEHSTSKSVSKAVTHMSTVTTGAECPAKTDMHTWLYQWVVEGRHPGTPASSPSDATVSSPSWRCQYSAPGKPQPVPHCPYQFCGDVSCTAAKCLDWKKK